MGPTLNRSRGPARGAETTDTPAVVGMAGIGLRSVGAAALIAGFVLVCVAITIATPGVGIWRSAAAYALMVVAAAIVLRVTGDPLRPRATAVVAVTPALMVLIGAPGLPASPLLPTTALTAAVAMVAAFLCVRHRVRVSIAAYLGSVATAVVVLPQSGTVGITTSTWITVGMPDLAVMISAVAFAVFIRHAAVRIGAMRARTEREIAGRAAVAQADESIAQMVRLDEHARGLLSRIAEGGRLTDSERELCRLTEGRLRDAIRAPALDRPDLAQAVWAARGSGVSVTLLDDSDTDSHGDVPPDDPARLQIVDELCAAAVDLLSTMPRDSSITVRVRPRGRSPIGTIVARDAPHTLRRVFGADSETGDIRRSR
jgi:hypothetical protein